MHQTTFSNRLTTRVIAIKCWPDVKADFQPSWRIGKAVRNYSVCTGIWWQITFFKIEFYTIYESQHLNTEQNIVFTKSEGCSFARTGSINFLIFHTFLCKFGRVEGAAREKNYWQMYEKLTERLLFNLHSSNLVNTIFYLVF